MKVLVYILSMPIFFAIGYFCTAYFLAPQEFTYRMPAASDYGHESADFASETAQPASYKITDGYGSYVGTGKTKLKARDMAWQSCVLSKVRAYESRHGVTPDPDTADLYIDACINK